MNNTVERLREFSRWLIEHDVDMSLPDGFIDPAEAADEIERLRAVLVDNAAALAAAISLLERGGKKAAPSDKMFEMMLNDYRISLEAARTVLTKQTQEASDD